MIYKNSLILKHKRNILKQIRMKRLLLLFIAAFAVTIAYSQKGKVAAASAFLDNGDLESARTRLNDALKHDKTKGWARTYIVSARLAAEEYNKTNDFDKILEAVDNYFTANEIDENDDRQGLLGRKGSFQKDIKVGLTFFMPELQNAGVDAFNSENYEVAMNLFRNVIELNKLSVFKEDNLPIDSMFIYYTGLAASRCKKYDVAEEYFKEAIEIDFGEGDPVLLLHEIYTETKDSTKIGPNLLNGFELYPDDERILNTLINYYLQTEQYDEALGYLDEAIKREPENATYFNARGVLYDMSEQFEEAEEQYLEAIKYNPDFFDPTLNLGVIYYNRAAEMMIEANDIEDFREFEIARDEAQEMFRKSLPFIERANEIKPDEIMVMETLRNLYYRFEMTEEYDEIDRKIKEVQE